MLNAASGAVSSASFLGRSISAHRKLARSEVVYRKYLNSALQPSGHQKAPVANKNYPSVVVV